MPKYEYIKFSAGPLPFRIDDPQIETTDFDEAVSHLQQRNTGTITAHVTVPIETPFFAILTKQEMAGKTRSQILEMFDNEIDRIMARIDLRPKDY